MRIQATTINFDGDVGKIAVSRFTSKGWIVCLECVLGDDMSIASWSGVDMTFHRENLFKLCEYARICEDPAVEKFRAFLQGLEADL